MGLVFEELEPTPSSVAHLGDCTLYVHMVEAAWGYSLWLDGRCVSGRFDPSWSRSQAIIEAERKLRELA